MGAGLSADIKKHLLEDWEPKKAAPPALEKEVRGFLQRARDLLEVYLAPHAPDAQGPPSADAPRRPSWLEPQQLHVALVGQDRLIDTFLESLGELAPLLEVVSEEGGTEPEEEEDGSAGLRALDRAAQAGFRCHAFVDEDLHLLRFWALGESALPADGKLAVPGLPYLDLVVLLVEPGAEQAAVGSQAERQPRPKGGAGEAAAQKQAQQRAALEAELASLQGRLAALPPPSEAPATAQADEERRALVEEFQRAVAELAGLGGGGNAVGPVEAELKAVRAKKQALIEEEDYDGAHEAKQQEKKLMSKLEELKKVQERTQELEAKIRGLEVKLRSTTPQADASAEKRLSLEEELKEIQALKRALIEAEDYDGAHDAKEREKQLLSELEELKKESNGGNDERAALEEELKQVRARKQALIEAEDYDEAHEAKMKEKELLAKLERLGKPAGGGGAAAAELAAVEDRLRRLRARKQELIEAEDYEGAHEAKQEEKALLAKLEELKKQSGTDDGGRSALEEELKQVRAKKQALIEAEDYDAAHEAKQQEKALIAKIESLKQPSSSGDAERMAAERKKAAYEAELKQVQAQKKAMIEAEDYDGAHEAKVKEKELLAKIEGLRKPEGGSLDEKREVERELREVRGLKKALKEAEDYDGALEAKFQELELEARLETLGENGGTGSALARELKEVQAKKRAFLQAEDYDAAHDAQLRERQLKAQLESGGSASQGHSEKSKEEQSRSALEEDIARVQGMLLELEKQSAAAAQKVQALEEELELVRAEKRELIEAEDFDGAHEAKQREKELLAELESLGMEGAAEPGREEGRKDAGTTIAWSDKVEPLAGSGKPPVLVASCGTAPDTLRQAAGSKLKAVQVVELADLERRRCEAGCFWDALRAGIHMVKTHRAFPECPPYDLGGGYSLGDWIFIQDEQHPLDGTYGIAIGFEDDGTWDFKITVRLVDGQVLSLPQDKINMLATEVKFDVSSLVELKNMDMLWVRLKDLKGRADLNDSEGYATVYSIQKKEEGYASIYDCPPRHTVTLEDGGEVRVKVDNFDILEKDRPALQEMPGLVDRLHLDGERYSVLVVRMAERGPVTVHGLTKRPDLNGERGVVVDFDEERDRFTVKMDVGSAEVAVQRANLSFAVPRTLAQRLLLRPQCVEEFQGKPEKPGRKREQMDEARDEELIGAALDKSRRARGEL